jgi:fermentation-respiration switch protein FrsA (DUF1100 family)
MLPMRKVLILLALPVALYLAVVAAMFACQRDLQYLPSHRAPLPSEAGFDEATEYALAAADGTRILLWFAPPEAGQPTVLFLHGNAGEMADRAGRWRAYRAAGLGTAFLEYRGYGGSDGKPTEAGLHQDADAALDWLEMRGIAPARVAVVGESLGTGVAVRLAADRPVGALVLGAPFTSAADVAARAWPWLPVRLLMRDTYPSVDRIARVTAPLLVLHGDADLVVPFDLSEALFAAAPGRKEFLPLSGQGHAALDDPAAWAAEIAFIARTLPPG